MNKSTFVVLLVAFLATAFASDVAIYGTFTAVDATASSNGVTVSAGASLTSVSFTALPSDPSIVISYPGSATQYNVGSISNGANGYGNFQVISSAGNYLITIVVKYKKNGLWNSYNSTFNLYVEGGDSTSWGKRIVNPRDEEVVLQSESNGNADFSIQPGEGWVSEDAIATWQSIQISSKGPALSSVTYTILPQGEDVIVSYNDRTGNVIGSIPANGAGRSDFQMIGSAGTHLLNVRINYRKSGVPRNHTEVMRLYVSGGDDTSYGKRAVVQPKATVAPVQTQFNNMTVIGLAIGGIALVAIVAVVVVVAVVRRQRAEIVA